MVLSDRGSAFILLRSAFRRSRFDIFELLKHSAEGQKPPNKHLPRRIKGAHTTFQHIVCVWLEKNKSNTIIYVDTLPVNSGSHKHWALGRTASLALFIGNERKVRFYLFEPDINQRSRARLLLGGISDCLESSAATRGRWPQSTTLLCYNFCSITSRLNTPIQHKNDDYLLRGLICGGIFQQNCHVSHCLVIVRRLNLGFRKTRVIHRTLEANI